MRMLGILCLGVMFPALVWAQTAQTDFQKCEQWSGDEAIAACTRAIQSGQLSPRDLSIMYNDRGVEWKERGENDKAFADYNEALRIRANYPNPYMNRGNVWLDKAEHDKAIADYNEALRLNPNWPTPYFNRGMAWQKKGDHDKAIADYTQFIGMKPDDKQVYCRRSEVWALKNETAKAAADEQRCKELGGK